MKGNKLNRYNSVVMRNVSNTINTKINDTEITGAVTITKVDSTPDLKICHIYISTGGSKEEQKRVLQKLKKAGSFIRGELAHGEALRITPRLEFHLDDSLDYGMHIDSLLKGLVIPPVEDDV